MDIILTAGTLTLLNPDEITSKNSICRVSCSIHGDGDLFNTPFRPKYGSFIKKSGCPKCTGRYRGNAEDLKEAIIKALHPTLTLIQLDAFDGQKTPVFVQCKEHGNCWEFGNPWTPQFKTLKNGNPCIKCTGAYHPTKDELIAELNQLLPEKLLVRDIIDYKNQNSRCVVECVDHGLMSEWDVPHEPTIQRLQVEPICRKCNDSYQGTKAEVIGELNEKLKRCAKTPTLQVLDIIGELTYRSQCIVLCPEHGRLDQFGQPITPTVDALRHVHKYPNRNGCPKCGGNYRYSQIEYETMIRNHLEKTNPSLTLVAIRNFKNNASLCELRCQHHGLLSEFATPCLPSIAKVLCLTTEAGCPKCSKTYRRTEDEVLAMYGPSSGLDPYIRAFEPDGFLGLETRCYITCTEHGDSDLFANPHNPTVESFINTPKCPKCNGTYQRTEEEIIAELNVISDGYYHVKSIPKFEGVNSTVFAVCPFHGEWSPTAAKLYAGGGCKECFHESHNLIKLVNHPEHWWRKRKLYFGKFTVIETQEIFYKIGLMTNSETTRYSKGNLEKDGLTLEILAVHEDANIDVSLAELYTLINYNAYRRNCSHLLKACTGGTECFAVNLLDMVSLPELVEAARVNREALIERAQRFNRYETTVDELI